MIKINKTIEINKLVIEYDEYSDSPREWDNLGYFITVDKSHYSPDDNTNLINIVKETGDIATSQEEHIKLITKAINETDEKVLAIYPIVKYQHGNVLYKLGTEHGFDCSNNGFYIVTDKTQKNIGTSPEDFEKAINNELETYNKWINGEVYCFTLYDENGDVEDSCGGFYSLEDIKDYLSDEWKNEDLSEYIKY